VDTDENQKQNRATSDDNQTWRDDTLREVRNLQNTVVNQSKTQSADYETLLKEIEKLGHLSQLRSTTPWSQPAAQPQPSSPPVHGQLPRVCFNCNQPGHFAKDCEEPRRNNYQRRTEGQVVLQNLEIKQARSLYTGGTKTKAKRATDQSTDLRAMIGKYMTDCLLDTGSQTTIIPASFVNPQYLVRTTQTLTAANGTSIPKLGKVTLQMKIGKYITSVHGLVSEHVPEVMIGIDWMSDNHVVRERGTSLIRIGEHSFNLKSKPYEGEHVRTGQPPVGGPADRPLTHYDGQYSVPNGSENNNVYTAKTAKQSNGSSSVKQVTGTKSVTVASGIGRSNDSNQPNDGQIESTQASNEENNVSNEVMISEVTASAEDQLSSVPFSWTWDDLIAAQRVDPEIAPVYQWLEESSERPTWDAVSLKSSGTKALWNMWPRLAFQGNVLRRRFENAEGNDDVADRTAESL